MRRQLYIIIILFLSFLPDLSAQDIDISSISLPAAYNASTITGLSQDPTGNIWLATNNQGLLKYNGESYSSYSHNKNDPNSLISDRLECIFADKDGYIWIGSFAMGLSKYHPATETFSTYVNDESDPGSIRSNSIRSIIQDKQGIIWVGTAAGIDYYNPKTDQFERDFADSPGAEILKSEHVRKLHIDRAGMLWAGSSSPFYGEETQGGLFRIDPIVKSVKRYSHSSDSESLVENQVTAIFEDSRGIFWVGTSGDGLHTMDRELGTFTRHVYDPNNETRLSRSPVRDFNYARDHIRFINEDINGHIWFGTMGNGMTRYDPTKNTVQHFNTDPKNDHQLPHNNVWSAIKTKDNLMWVTGWSPGNTDHVFFKINFEPLLIDPINLDMSIFSFAEDEQGDIYMGSHNKLVKLDELNSYDSILDLEHLPAMDLIHLNLDDNGNIWISTNEGLLFFNPNTLEYELFPLLTGQANREYLTDINMTFDINPDSILVASRNGLHLFNVKEKKFYPIQFTAEYVNSNTTNWVNYGFIDSRNNIWIGFSHYGLQKLDSDLRTFKDYRFLETVQDGPIYLYEDESDNFYVGNWRTGLRKYDHEKDEFLVIADGNGILTAETRVSEIHSISDSLLLLFTSNGPIKYNINQNSSFVYDVGELQDIDVTSFVFTSSAEDFYVGTSSGYIKFKPEDFERKTTATSTPTFGRFKVGDYDISTTSSDIDEKLEFKYDENDVRITLNYIDYISAAGDRNLQYMLENYDEGWRVGQNDEEVSYFKLLPGQYKFVVQAMDSYGEWMTKSITFKILPPWWKSWWAYTLYAIGLILGGWSIHKYQRTRTIRIEREKTKDRELAQAKKVEKAYADLKETQAQLIQSEKMASLGELTAGIAHEIQNPLNFVNNFAEVSAELIDEMTEEIEKGDISEVTSISQDLKQNLEKIFHHGRRADGIVKGMLQHSRSGSDEKVLTDINALADEYFRLAYHGLRAKDTSFNASMNPLYDENLPKINIVPQEIGRVLLNLITNAFHTVDDQAKSNGQTSYKPEVSIITKSVFESDSKEAKGIEIVVKDNGKGIPEEIKDKIFQPFFTTKPTGTGTGLGLSLSYDIIKSHNGSIEVNSEEGKGTAFKIFIPNENH